MYAATYMFLAPALALSIVVFGVNMFGDAIRDVLDPRLRGTGK
jgi:peptide/nickel transport system permease protein